MLTLASVIHIGSTVVQRVWLYARSLVPLSEERATVADVANEM